MRRFAAVMNHRSAGFKANAMGVWAVPDEQLDEIGPQMAGFAAVSHCYRRPTYDDWPYSVFTMVHGRSARDCEATIDAIRTETGVDEYCLLWSIKEYKKVRVQLLHARLGRLELRTTSTAARNPPGRNPRAQQHGRDRGDLRAAGSFAGGGDASRIASSLRVPRHPSRVLDPVVGDHPRIREIRDDRRWRVAEAAVPQHLEHALSGFVRQAGHVAAGQAARSRPRAAANRRPRR